jgi:hypothetical protein
VPKAIANGEQRENEHITQDARDASSRLCIVTSDRVRGNAKYTVSRTSSDTRRTVHAVLMPTAYAVDLCSVLMDSLAGDLLRCYVHGWTRMLSRTLTPQTLAAGQSNEMDECYAPKREKSGQETVLSTHSLIEAGEEHDDSGPVAPGECFWAFYVGVACG